VGENTGMTQNTPPGLQIYFKRHSQPFWPQTDRLSHKWEHSHFLNTFAAAKIK